MMIWNTKMTIIVETIRMQRNWRSAQRMKRATTMITQRKMITLTLQVNVPT